MPAPGSSPPPVSTRGLLASTSLPPQTTAPLTPIAAATTAAAVVRPAQTMTLSLSQPAQAAARQDSMAPLLQNLSSLTGKLADMPKPVAEAAIKVMAARLSIDRGITGESIKQAVLGSGVFAEASGKGGGQPADVKSSLLQLRTALQTMLAGSSFASVAASGHRPAPPMRDAQPRGMLPEAPTLAADAKPQDAARTLLHQTDGALSRLKLTQLAAQPDGAARAAVAAATQDFTVELPMLLGGQLSMLQLQVQRDGKQKQKASERGWRVRFAVSFAAIGEVGAQVALLGKTTNVVVWAAEDATADALEEMLPELAPTLAARGLTVGSVLLRRRAPEADHPAPSGRLMDTLT